jgi:transcriptional regulator with XRE-family HTH domain
VRSRYLAHMREKKLFSERLRAAMKARGLELSGAVLEREFNSHWLGTPVRRQTAWKWLNGETIPTQDKIQVLALWLKIEPHELRFGEFVQQHLQAAEKRWQDGAGYAERETFEAFLALPAAQRKIIREVILAFSKASTIDV